MTEKQIPQPVPGTVLPNGATVLASRITSVGDAAVLCWIPRGGFYPMGGEYATWWCDPATGACTSGNYFYALDSFGEAVADFMRRVGAVMA